MSAEELKEVVGFLRHRNPAVQQESCRILTQLCASPSTLASLASLDVVPALLPITSSPPPVQSSALTLLLVLSTSDPLLPFLLSHPTISTLIELLRTSPSPPPPSTLPALQLLVNLTRTEPGAQQLMQEGTPLEGLHMRRLLSWFLLPPFAGDPYQHVASLLLNVSQLPSGRRWLMAASTGALVGLPRYIVDGGEVRQRDVLTMFRNLFLESASHPLLLQPVHRVLENVLLLLAGEGEVREEERDGFFPSVLRAMTPSHPRHPDASIRRLCLEVITLCAREKQSRAVLKQRRVYPVLRELHRVLEQSERGDKELDDALYDIVAYFILPEDEEAAEEQRRAREAKSARAAANESLPERKRDSEGECKEEKEERLPLPRVKAEVRAREDELEEVDEKTAALLSDLNASSKAVEAEVQRTRAAREEEKRRRRQHADDVQRQMELHERIDDSVENATEEGRGNGLDEDDLPELIDEGPSPSSAAADAIDSMD